MDRRFSNIHGLSRIGLQKLKGMIKKLNTLFMGVRLKDEVPRMTVKTTFKNISYNYRTWKHQDSILSRRNYLKMSLLGAIAIRSNKRVIYNPEKMSFTDSTLKAFINEPIRKGWESGDGII